MLDEKDEIDALHEIDEIGLSMSKYSKLKKIGEPDMKFSRSLSSIGLLVSLAVVGVLFTAPRLQSQEKSALLSLLPEIPGWKPSEAPQTYRPDTLFQYIDGAAEIYLSYDFRELVVGQFKAEEGKASLTLEIYDMGNEKNSFGIYSAERFSENKFISLGMQGYVGEGELIFAAGQDYVKILCFDCGPDAEKTLHLFGERVVQKIGRTGEFPRILNAFPREGLVANSEKLVLRNFLGLSALHDGYLATYKVGGFVFECFIVEGKGPDDARKMLEEYLAFARKNNQEMTAVAGGTHLKDRYAHHVYIAQVGARLCGVTRIKDEAQSLGESYLEKLVKELEGRR